MASLAFRLAQDLAVSLMYSPAGMNAALDSYLAGGDTSAQALRACLTDVVILANIGDLAAAGYGPANDLSSTESIPDWSQVDPLAKQQIFAQSLTGDLGYLTAGYAGASGGTNEAAWVSTTLYLFGDYNPASRISRFCSVLFYRLAIGDSVAHATYVALKDMETFAVSASALNMNDYQLYPPNYYSSGVYRDDDSSVAPPLAPAIKQCLGPIVARLYSQADPVSFANDTTINQAVLAAAPVADPSMMVGSDGSSPVAKVTLSSGSSNNLYYLGAAAAIAGLALLLTRKKAT